MNKTSRAFLKALSQVFANLSAAWFTLAFITPNFSNAFNTKAIIVLTTDIVFGIVFLALTTIAERIITNE